MSHFSGSPIPTVQPPKLADVGDCAVSVLLAVCSVPTLAWRTDTARGAAHFIKLPSLFRTRRRFSIFAFARRGSCTGGTPRCEGPLHSDAVRATDAGQLFAVVCCCSGSAAVEGESWCERCERCARRPPAGRAGGRLAARCAAQSLPGRGAVRLAESLPAAALESSREWRELARARRRAPR